LITGVHRGLGRDLTLQCLERGAEVIGVLRDAGSRDALRAEFPLRARLTLVAADLSQPGALAAALGDNRITPRSITMAIVSAGTKHDGSSVRSLPELRETFEVNFFAAAELITWLCGSEATAEGLSADVAGRSVRALSTPGAVGDSAGATAPVSATTRIVLISSMGRWHGMPFSGGYNASKAALSIWGESLDLELRRSGKGRYTVTVVEPGMFPSSMMRQTGLNRALFVSRAKVAERILHGALAGRAVIRPPRWFALLTWTMCLLGRGFRARVFSKAKLPRQDR
jgi:short-subunit dehydrogenase